MQIDNKIGVRRFGLVNWIGVMTLVKREIMRFLAVWNQTIAAPMVTSGLFLLIFNIAVGPNRGLVMGYSYIIFMVPGIVMMSIIQNAFANTSSSIMTSKIQGNIVDTLMPPLSAGEMLEGYVLGGIARGLFVAIGLWIGCEFVLGIEVAHPLLALVILGQELYAFRRPERRYYPQVLAAVPIGLAVLLAGLSARGYIGPSEIRSFFLATPGSPLFLATHTYLELIHYVVWIGLLPLLAQLTQRGNIKVYPFLKKSAGRLRAARQLLLLGAVLACVLWWGFTQDFELTRDLYFRIAIFHVLVEFPFLMRLL